MLCPMSGTSSGEMAEPFAGGEFWEFLGVLGADSSTPIRKTTQRSRYSQRLVDHLYYEPVPVVGSFPPPNARSAIR